MIVYMQEFDCKICGRHIILFCGIEGTVVCATCLWLPGWHTYPELQHLDPELDKWNPNDAK